MIGTVEIGVQLRGRQGPSALCEWGSIPNHPAYTLAIVLQEALGQVFSKFGTSPEELLKEEETWTNGVQQVREAR